MTQTRHVQELQADFQIVFEEGTQRPHQDFTEDGFSVEYPEFADHHHLWWYDSQVWLSQT